MPDVFVSAGFDAPLSPHVRFLQEAARLGPVRVLLWPDHVLQAVNGQPPRFTLPERRYFIESLRFVHEVQELPEGTAVDALPEDLAKPGTAWATCDEVGIPAEHANAARQEWCRDHGVRLVQVPAQALQGFPRLPEPPFAAGPRQSALVVATGSFDWLHAGHVRFFEEAAALGDLVVVVGHDANIRLLKGEGHPRFGQEERRYMVSAVRAVSRALISTGDGWLDAEPELQRLQPDIYVVNEDGDKPEKRDYCGAHGIRYVVLKRTPKPGLPRRSSTELRGF